MSLRPSTFEVAVDADEGRRQAVENIDEICKSRREESLFKNRREELQNQQSHSAYNTDVDKREQDTSGEERSCSICNTTKTPLWRGGPSGPKSLCNACGIKYRKKRREALGLESGGVKKENRSREEESGASEKKSKSSSSNNSKGISLKLKMVGLKGEVVINKKKRKMMMKIGEEERAAMLLMALSSGCVHG